MAMTAKQTSIAWGSVGLIWLVQCAMEMTNGHTILAGLEFMIFMMSGMTALLEAVTEAMRRQ